MEEELVTDIDEMVELLRDDVDEVVFVEVEDDSAAPD